jgi:low temperature requirement protein LtrA
MTAPRPWYRPMTARSPDEPYRASTPLELFFDLCFVVAVAQAAALLHHDVSAAHHIGHAVLAYAMVFFAIWWAWMNFTWFASAYDTDDDVYRLTVLVTIVGALIIAAGIPRSFTDGDFTVVTVGYTVMRVANVAQWLRAARADPPRRVTDLRYAVGIGVVQVGWLLRLLLEPAPWGYAGFVGLVVAELLVPVLAERNAVTTYHPHHIAERYGLFTLIVLGESVLAASLAVQVALDAGAGSSLLPIAACGVVIVFAMWWLYFDRSAVPLLRRLRTSILWGYGHYFVFTSAAATGAGIAVTVDRATGAARLSQAGAGYALALPVAVYLAAVWLLHVRPHQRGPGLLAYPVAVVLVLLAPFGPAPYALVAAVAAGLVVVTVLAGRRVPDRLQESPQR